MRLQTSLFQGRDFSRESWNRARVRSQCVREQGDVLSLTLASAEFRIPKMPELLHRRELIDAGGPGEEQKPDESGAARLLLGVRAHPRLVGGVGGLRLEQLAPFEGLIRIEALERIFDLEVVSRLVV